MIHEIEGGDDAEIIFWSGSCAACDVERGHDDGAESGIEHGFRLGVA